MSNNPQSQSQSPEKLVKMRAVMERVCLSRSGIYAMMGRGEFPLPIKLGVKSIAFRESEITDWINQCQRADIQVNTQAA